MAPQPYNTFADLAGDLLASGCTLLLKFLLDEEKRDDVDIYSYLLSRI
jgi:hypothetical protein